MIKIKKLLNKKGVLSVEFLFTFSVTCLLVIYLFMVTVTFSFIEISQYIAFKTSRMYFIGNHGEGMQKTEAEQKFDQLKGKLFPRNLDSWFEVNLVEANHGFSDPENPSYSLFLGTKLILKPKVLSFSIPFIEGAGNENFEFEIYSFLGREPSQEECESFKNKRAEWIKDLTGYDRVSVAVNIFKTENGYLGNGC